MATCPPAMCVPSPTSPTATLHSQRKIRDTIHPTLTTTTCPPAMCVPSPTATLHSQRKILGYTHFNPNNSHLSTDHVFPALLQPCTLRGKYLVTHTSTLTTATCPPTMCSQPYCNPALSEENTWHNTPNPNNGHLSTDHVFPALLQPCTLSGKYVAQYTQP